MAAARPRRRSGGSDPSGEEPLQPARWRCSPTASGRSGSCTSWRRRRAPTTSRRRPACSPPLDAAALERAVQALVDRHAALRTTFPASPSDRRAAPAGRRARWPSRSAREDATGWSEERLRSRLAEEAWRPFDLERGPLLRVSLWTGGAGRSGRPAGHPSHRGRLLVAGGADAGAAGALPRGVRRRAGGARRRRASPTRSTSGWSRRPCAAAAARSCSPTGGERLAGLPTLELATDRPRPAIQTYHGDATGCGCRRSWRRPCGRSAGRGTARCS